MRSHAVRIPDVTFAPRADDELADHPNSGLAVATILCIAPILSIAGLIWLFH